MTQQRETQNMIFIGILCAALQALTLLAASVLITYVFQINNRVIEQGERLSRMEGAQKERVLSSALMKQDDALISAKDWQP